MAHLAPFVDVSRQSIIKELRETMPELDEDRFNAIVEKRLLKEIEKGVQTMQYQINTLNTSNG